jgi:xylan 1,4-beta-xylosidase
MQHLKPRIFPEYEKPTRSIPTGVFLRLIFIFAFVFPVLAQNYKNPVIPGDFPDPSVIRVGEDYYATATTGGWSPHFPILHSKDLVNWKIVGAVLYRKPEWVKGDFWAPEIVEDRGRYFVYYTARREEGKGKKGTLCVAVAVAEKPDGPYTDKGALVCQEMGSIDADFVRDENEKPYLMWKEDGNDRQKPTWLYAQELDESGTRLVGKPTRLFRNTEPWEGHVVEGSFVVRRGEWFYLFYSGNACCGRQCNYALGVARAKKLLGPWEKNPANPILAENEYWQCPGHGSIVSTADGRDFLLYHAYRRNSVGFNIGREALLDEVKYENGWAQINGGRGASETAPNPFKNIVQQSIFAGSSDEFDGNALAPRWNQSFSDENTARVQNGFLSLAPTEKHLASEKMPEIVVAERTVTGTYEASTRIDIADSVSEEYGGISVYGWRLRAAGISTGDGKILVWQRSDGPQKILSSAALPAGTKAVYLKIKAASAALLQFSYSFDGQNWNALGEKIGGSYIEGARIALVYNGKNSVPGVRFDWVRVTAN